MNVSGCCSAKSWTFTPLSMFCCLSQVSFQDYPVNSSMLISFNSSCFHDEENHQHSQMLKPPCFLLGILYFWWRSVLVFYTHTIWHIGQKSFDSTWQEKKTLLSHVTAAFLGFQHVVSRRMIFFLTLHFSVTKGLDLWNAQLMVVTFTSHQVYNT